jgi:hypothetical protein
LLITGEPQQQARDRRKTEFKRLHRHRRALTTFEHGLIQNLPKVPTSPFLDSFRYVQAHSLTVGCASMTSQ